MDRMLYSLLLLLIVSTFPAYGNTYLGVEQAQKLMFGDIKFTPVYDTINWGNSLNHEKSLISARAL